MSQQPDTLGDLIGHELADDLTPQQRTDVRKALGENEAGVIRLAHEAVTKPAITNPAGYLIAKIRQGAHERRSPPQRQPAADPLLDRVERAYHTRLAAHPDHDRRAAIEYAIDFYAPGRHDLENELRRRTSNAEPGPTAPPSTAERWLRIHAAANRLAGQPDHPLRIAIRETTSRPTSDAEALEVLAYLEAVARDTARLRSVA